jgi:tetratricopeptide (TPR) repeat protein
MNFGVDLGPLVDLAKALGILDEGGAPDDQWLRAPGDKLVHYREMGSVNHVGITLRSMANAHLQLGQADEAVRCAEEAVDLATWLEFPLDIAQADNILGAAHRQLGELTRAEIAYQQALEMSRRCESDFEQAWARCGLGAVALAAGRPDNALRHWQVALVLYRDVGSTLADDVAANIHQVKAAQESPA